MTRRAVVGIAVTTAAALVLQRSTASLPLVTTAIFDFTQTTLGGMHAAPGATISVTVSVLNKGRAAASPKFGGGITVAGIAAAAWVPPSSVPSIAPGASRDVTLTLTVPTSLAGTADPISLSVSP